jgi:hypothetical protein
MTEPIVYIAGVDGAGVNDFVVPEIDQAGAPYSGTISELKVEVNGSEVTSGYTVAAGVLTFDVDLAAGDILRLYRKTDATDSMVVFPNPVKYSPVHHNKSITQFLYILQEIWGWIRSFAMLIVDGTQERYWDAKSLNIRNVGDATDETEAVNLGQLNAAIATALTTAGLGSISEGTLAEGATTIDFVGDIAGVYLSIAGMTFYVRQGVAGGGGSLVYNSETNTTTFTFDDVVLGGPHQYIAIQFQ